jgi:fido (protein-threonine AMPylation protein)
VNGILEEPDSGTPLTPEEMRDLIPAHIAYRRELNEAEQENIVRAEEWALSSRRRDPLSEKFIRDLHNHMFGDVWRWAGKSPCVFITGLSAYTRSRTAMAVMPA